MKIARTLSITTAPTYTRLTSVETVKDELDIDDTGVYDPMLERKIEEATSDIELHIPRKLARCGITETIWPQSGYACLNHIDLARTPVVSITSVTVDGVALTADEYRLDSDGRLYRRESGTADRWEWSDDIVIVYTGGFRMPEDPSYVAGDLFSVPASLQSAAIELVASFWASRGRDPNIMEEENPGVSRFRYWVGAVGEKGELPPSVMAKIAPMRRLVL